MPHLGRDARHLYVFQRTPSSVDVRDNRPTDPEWARSLAPGWQRRRRENFLSVVHDRADEDLVADAWTRSPHAVVVGDTSYEVDCVVFATGFEVGVSGVLSGQLPVYGRDGVPLLAHWADGPRSLHGFYCDGFPNLFHLGPLQNASSVNFTHILDEQATHIGAIVAQARARGARYVEPSVAAVDAWLATIREKAADVYKLQAECTPGYYNNEGMPSMESFSFGDGPVAFHELLRRWRADGMDDVMVVDA